MARFHTDGRVKQVAPVAVETNSATALLKLLSCRHAATGAGVGRCPQICSLFPKKSNKHRVRHIFARGAVYDGILCYVIFSTLYMYVILRI